MKPRAAVILIRNDAIALIERHRSGRHYFVFPGGKIQSDETAENAAEREAREELGLELKIGRMVAEVWYQGTPQYYFLADLLGGRFGQGTGSEMSSLPDSEKGSYLPIWMPVAELTGHPVLPVLMAEYVWKSYQNQWSDAPLYVTDRPPDTV